MAKRASQRISWRWLSNKDNLVAAALFGLEITTKIFPDSYFLGKNFVIHVAILCALLFFPGHSWIKLFRLRLSSWHFAVTLSIGFSLIFLMVSGALLSWLLPIIGVHNPLDATWVLIVLLGQQLLISKSLHNRTIENLPVNESEHSWQISKRVGFSLLFAVLPALTFVSESVLNTTSENLLAKIVSLSSTFAILFLIVIRRSLAFRIDYPIALFFISLSFFWLASLRGFSVTGFDVQSELGVTQDAIASSSWHVPQDGNAYSSMLSLTVLPAIVHALTGFEVLTLYKGVFPLIMALIVVNVFLALTSRARKGTALAILAAFVLPNPFFFIGLPALARQGIGLFFLSLVLLVFSQKNISPFAKRVLIIVLAAGISIAHYTTSYLFSALLVLGYIFLQLIDGTRVIRGFQRPKRTLTYYTVIGAASLSWVWNGFITKSTSEVNKLLDFIGKYGVKALPNQNEGPSNFVSSWISGSVVQNKITTRAIIKQALADRKNIYTWMQATPGVDGFVPKNLNYVKPTSDFLQNFAQFATTVLSQINVVSEAICVLLLFGLLVFRKNSRNNLVESAELVAFGMGALVIAAILRVSGTISLFLDPNRAALILNLFFCVSIAIALKGLNWKHSIDYFLAITFGVLLSFNFGIISLITNYNPIFWGSTRGVDQISKVATLQDVSAATWMADEIKGGIQLVSADFYGGNEISQTDGKAQFKVFPNVLPQLVDWRGYLFQAEHNTVPGISISSLNGTRYWYDFPVGTLTKYRLTVYSSELVRVYR